MNHSANRSRSRRRVLRGVASIALLTPFLSAPTPGNIGGCGGSLAATEISRHPGNTTGTLESVYFERGLCAGFCQRLLECGHLCAAMNPAVADCGTNEVATARAYYLCVHGTNNLSTEYFGTAFCPKSCVNYGGSFAYNGDGTRAFVYEWDVQVCNDAVLQRSCSINPNDPGGILTALRAAPSECANNNVCRR
ncbi:MAG: hypothetical protein JNK05_18640 [Myxococcales bacterium]|nr:hypothetical protein [Myxococcales bacterium]